MSPFQSLDPTRHVSSPLHAPTRSWPETNCYIDVWIEMLHAWGLDPRAALAFTVAQDFEGDHFTFFKYPPEDLSSLFGLAVQELAIYDTVEQHALAQLRRGRTLLVELDSFYMPDTSGTAYRAQHVKTTVGIGDIDIAARRLDYFHNTGYHRLSGEDFDGVFRRAPDLADRPELLFPYVEFVKHDRPNLEGKALVGAAVTVLREHLARRPTANPILCYAAELPRHLDALSTRSMAYFHLYAFNHMRQLGANFELLGSFVEWLAEKGEKGLEPVRNASDAIATGAKALQFQLARSINRKKPGNFGTAVESLAMSYELAIGTLVARYS